MEAASRHDFAFWVVIADLDHFKTINDSYGHDAGDTVLKGFAAILRSNTRNSNICGRLGGEEFLVLITHIEKENVAIAIERIRRKFEEQIFVFDGRTCRASASFGIAGFRGPVAPDFRELVARADAALYSAKCKGRNRIEFATQLASPSTTAKPTSQS